MKKKSKLKAIVAVVAVVVAVIVAVLAFKVTSDLKKEKELNNEIESLYSLLNTYPLDYEALDKKLSAVVTTDDYAKVEKAIKEYSADFVDNMKQFDELINDETLTNAVSVENIKKDGPDFAETKKNLSQSKVSLEKVLTNISDYLTEETAMSYIKDIELDDYYKDLYKQYALGDNLSEMQSARDEIMKSLNDVKALIENEEETINFLVKNKGKWEVEDNQLVFYSEALTKQYNDIISKIKVSE